MAEYYSQVANHSTQDYNYCMRSDAIGRNDDEPDTVMNTYQNYKFLSILH